MANILDRYGIKEVADVCFYHINATTKAPDYPVLVLDSLKVTSIEQTAETAEARGGKGNAKLIVWDYGKEITVNIEDALFSPQSLSIMFSDGSVKTPAGTDASKDYIQKSARVVVETTSSLPKLFIDGTKVTNATSLVYYKADGTGSMTSVTAGQVSVGDVLFATWNQPVNANTKQMITITPDSFPGTYYVTGDTKVRNQSTGADEYFQFIIPKAKMQAENTITMEADGDPSTFNMSLQILRPDNGEMVKFVKYDIDFGTVISVAAGD